MTIPRVFLKDRELIASYDFSTVIEGIEGLVFYVGSGNDNTPTENSVLKSNPFYSQSIEAQWGSGNLTGSFVAKITKNYNLTVTQTATIAAGDAMMSFGWGVYGHANATITGYIQVSLSVVGGATIGSAKTYQIAKAGAAWSIDTAGLKLETTETNLKKGDVLRLTMIGYLKTSSGILGGDILWGQDPMNRDGSALTPSSSDEPTRNQIAIPFKSDL